MHDFTTEVSNYFNISSRDALNLIITAPRRYKVFNIPKKKTGTFRTIAQPAKEVKILQNWLISNLKDHLPIHSAATAYTPGSGIRNNAAQHASNEFIVKIDFRNFFNSILASDFLNHMLRYFPSISDTLEISLMASVLFWRPKGTSQLCLSVGAPSSPFISNTIMYTFDKTISSYCFENNITYTRYADDLTLSAHDHKLLSNAYKHIEKYCNDNMHPKLAINETKTLYLSKKNSRLVTGLIITNDEKVSIGHKRKRLLHSMVYNFKNKSLTPEETSKLRGLLAFINDVEPAFLNKLKEKYGNITIDSIFKTRQDSL